MFIPFIPFIWGLGLISAAVILTFRRGQASLQIWAAILTLTSGAYFPVEYFPPWLQAIAENNPMTQVLNGAREALLGHPTGPWYGTSYPLSFPLRSSPSRSGLSPSEWR